MSVPLVSIRPLAVRVIVWGMILVALWNMGRAVALIIQLDWLAELALSPDPRLHLALAIVWAALLLMSAAGLVKRLGWARPVVPLLLVIYGVYELGMMIAFATMPPAPLPVLAYALFVGYAGWVLWRRRDIFPTSGPKEVAEPGTL